ncbi:class Ib ribonucleoside-diphosphate reductase assembly flavoprotein NrdI [Corynebacterium liangguodongii]|uniref:Protein NrdI n=1 Tax=Corynebacterium liangguodongii TaxID=2079535 RepID=A0A2S0WFQ1_9CORY|nr:class Ib ribonucleoside-diphosphate reductase assembly flavoprotein NrdI [Corynebacterium liangguodongii]AWB84589.1 class Ib ribonucleoside-diphosphate reductase assembly flavoprotein NrdI [Corynebacterium liangguodongii]PWB98826.1 class Ib ribonucleoside-diphosphate reductase assembly flavoprotein NrdI [Corynebacterium liangguodongii]
MLIVYFSSATGNTKRFVDKLGLPAARIPLRRTEPQLLAAEPYVLICPTYGGGASLTSEHTRPVPPQVERFLSNVGNRGLIRGVIASGNANFGPDFCRAGDVISRACSVPYLYRFELMGDEHDVTSVRAHLIENTQRLGLVPMPQAALAEVEARDAQARGEAAERLARLRQKYHHTTNA